jgi:hypothetical protein
MYAVGLLGWSRVQAAAAAAAAVAVCRSLEDDMLAPDPVVFAEEEEEEDDCEWCAPCDLCAPLAVVCSSACTKWYTPRGVSVHRNEHARRQAY